MGCWVYTYARAVRTDKPCCSSGAFVDNNNGTITDTETSLMWEKATSDYINWEAALNYCESLTLAGYDDWRLPNRNELHSLVDYSRFNPEIDINYFPSSVPGCYWSSTTNLIYGMIYAALGVDFDFGYVCGMGVNKGGSCYVRCVRATQSAPPITPFISQSPLSGPPGTTFTLQGNHFTPSSTATLHFQRPDGTEYPTKTQPIDSSGNFETTYTAPTDKAPGTYAWLAVNGQTAAKSNVVSYVIEGTAGALHHFTFSSIDAQQVAHSFPITIEARDYADNLVTSFNGEATLSLTVDAYITPNWVGFDNGRATADVTILEPFFMVAIQALSGNIGGESNRFAVTDTGSYVGRIVSYVVDNGANNNQPLAGATVTLTNTYEGTPFDVQHTDQNGFYTFEEVPAGKYSVQATYEERSSTPISLDVSAGKTSWPDKLIVRSKNRPVLLVAGIMGSDKNWTVVSAYPTLPYKMPDDQNDLILHNPGEISWSRSCWLGDYERSVVWPL